MARTKEFRIILEGGDDRYALRVKKLEGVSVFYRLNTNLAVLIRDFLTCFAEDSGRLVDARAISEKEKKEVLYTAGLFDRISELSRKDGWEKNAAGKMLFRKALSSLRKIFPQLWG